MSAEQSLRSPAECVVRVDDREISDLYPYLAEVRVESSREAATVCTLLIDSLRSESGDWLVQDAGILTPWKRILIEARFGERSEEIMRGYIRELRMDYPQEMGGAQVTVEGQDESLLLDREHLRRVWSTQEQQLSDGQIARQIGSDFGLDAQVEAGLTNTTLSCDTTAIRFLRERAAANGFELAVRRGTLYFGPPQLEGEAQPAIMVYAGQASNCINLVVRHDGHRPDQVWLTRQADDGTETEDEIFEPDLSLLGSDAIDSGSAGLGPFVWAMRQPPGATGEEQRTRAQAKANANAWKIVAEGELDGTLYGHVLMTHATVLVDGIGPTYDGRYYVDAVTHRFTADGYRQSFRLLRNATGEQSAAAQTQPLKQVV
ncbi:MAG: hypothetical protein PVG22_15080 [Chromatiales bacterium]|jgi:hypothetical protein